MSENTQIDLRDELCRRVLRALGDGDVTIEEAAGACMGAAAVVVALYPLPTRERGCAELDGFLLKRANRYAGQIRRGEFDRQQSGH